MDKILLVFLCAFGISFKASADSYVNVCDRGVIGDELAKVTYAKSCESVSVSKLAQITDLDLSSKNLTTIEENAFQGLTSLEILTLDSNPIRSISKDAFVGLKKLNSLSIMAAELTSLEEGTFRDQYQTLYILDLQINKLDAIPPDMMYMTGLSHLNLETNLIKMVPRGSFANAQKLTYIYLGYNQISTVEDGAFNGISHLRVLELGHNLLTDIPSRIFFGHEYLENIKLDGNKFSEIPLAVVDHPEIRDLDLSLNNITSVDRWVFQGKIFLYHLNLAGNQISEIDPSAFLDMIALTHLNLAGNPLTTLPDDIFSGCPELSWLSFTMSGVKSVSRSRLGIPEFTRIYGAKAER